MAGERLAELQLADAANHERAPVRIRPGQARTADDDALAGALLVHAAGGDLADVLVDAAHDQHRLSRPVARASLHRS